jgi:CheY-like chemotaxis protein
VAKTLLAVDDSVTMRKVLEITFSGEDYRVITADNAQSALGKLGENPNVFVIDTGLGGEDGYQLAKELRRRSPHAPIIMLASRYSPYDQGRGRDAGADDFADKPFDTQQLIDKVKKAVIAREASGAGAAPPTPMQMPPTPAAMPAREPPPAYRPPAAAAAPPIPAGVPRGTQPSLAGSVPRTGTLVFGEQPAPPPAPSPPAPPIAAAPPPVAAPPPRTSAGGMPAHAPPPAAAPRVDAAVNGQLAGKLGELGLTPQQADAVLALSREVVERIVWEVVPQLAEAMIKEEIARLTKD